MSDNLVPIKSFLGKYYTELLYSSSQDKYKNTNLDSFFDQRFYIQNNKMQMIIDPAMSGLTAIINGNEIYISKNFYDHPSILISNSLENSNQTTNTKNLYNSETFSTVAYLICQNHTMFQIVGEVDEPIYLKYKSEYESFYNSVVVFEISETIEVEIIEEIESRGALNAVTNYILHPTSKLNLTTFYQNSISALSFVYRNIIAQDDSSYTHMLFGKGSSNVIDENKIHSYHLSNADLYGIINSNSQNFHSILIVQPASEEYKVNVDYRDILIRKANVTFFPVIYGQEPADRAIISVSNIAINGEITETVESEIKKYINDLTERAILDRMVGVERFYNNKSKFLHFP